MSSLSITDWAVIVGALTGVGLLVYAVLDRHFPKEMAVSNEASFPGTIGHPSPKPTSGGRRLTIPIALAAVTWMLLVFDYADRHWFAQPAPAEISLGTNDARIDVKTLAPVINEKKQFFTNILLANNGNEQVLQWRFQGYAITGGLNDKDLVDAFFITLRTKINEQPPSELEMQIGQADQYISVPNLPPLIQWDDNSIQDYKDGKLPVFIFLVLQYTDNIIPVGKHIYSEKCAILTQDVLHNCPTHNRNFIAD
jgi:hypothetical protein